MSDNAHGLWLEIANNYYNSAISLGATNLQAPRSGDSVFDLKKKVAYYTDNVSPGIEDDLLQDVSIEGIDSRISSGENINIFTGSVRPLTRRTSCWAYGIVGLSSIAIDYSVTLITPEIVLYAIHNSPNIGAQPVFVAEDGSNNEHYRTITAKYNLGSQLTDASGDIGLARLDSPFPSAIKPSRLCNSTLLSYLPATPWGIPLLMSQQNNKASIGNWNSMGSIYPMQLEVAVPIAPPRSAYHVEKIVGDSGRACGLVVNGEFIFIMSLATASGAGTGWGNWQYLSAINAGISALGSSTTISLFDPSSL